LGALDVAISAIRTSGGDEIPLDKGSTLVIVGPNNAGKSRLLRDIKVELKHRDDSLKQVLASLDFEKRSSTHDFEDWFMARSAPIPPSVHGPGYRLTPAGVQDTIGSLIAWWESGPPFQTLAEELCFLADAEGRLGLSAPSKSFIPYRDAPSTPLQALFVDPDKEEALSELCKEAFNEGITLNKQGGQEIPLGYGELPVQLAGQIVVTKEYMEALADLPQLVDQGDGVRSFIGLMLALISNEFPIVLVDEPEVFLHPPTAKIVGKALARQQAGQIIVATHSSDVLQGLIDASNGNVTVARLTRDGDVNRAKVLSAEKLNELWSDPLLRYSRVLDGLFHSGVIICEGDADCRFYEAAIDFDRAVNDGDALDLLFVYTGGKHRISKLVKALMGFGVPVRVIADLDVLREEKELRGIAEALGADWASIQPLWNVLNSDVSTQAGTNISNETAAQRIEAIFDSAAQSYLDENVAGQIRKAVKTRSGWSSIKESGISAFPKGNATTDGTLLLAELEKFGLFLVPVGELECWDKSLGLHGPGWVAEALLSGSHQNRDIQEFVQRAITGITA
jgi:energy-coupling factor transporter ATP-binding protein EcfA2